MVENQQPSLVLEPEQTRSETALTQIERTHPNRLGFVRRIHQVYKSCYRVNFHERENNMEIADSYFVQVTPDGVISQ
jgi:hypothetical protein